MPRGIATKGSEEVSHPSSAISEEIRQVGERNLISRMFRRYEKNAQATDVKLPTKEELAEHIDSIFSYSEDSQPSRTLNAGVGVVDSTSILFAAYTRNVLFGGVAIASELVAFARNRGKKVYSEAVEEELSELKSYKHSMLSILKNELSNPKRDEKEIKELIKRTNKLFSDIESRSKGGLTTALGSRLEGIAGSALAIPVSMHPLSPYKQFIDGASSWVDGFIHSFPVQIPPYTELLAAAADIGIRVATFVVASSLLTYGVDWLSNLIHRNSSFETREGKREELKDRAGKLLDEIHEKCSKPQGLNTP